MVRVNASMDQDELRRQWLQDLAEQRREQQQKKMEGKPQAPVQTTSKQAKPPPGPAPSNDFFWDRRTSTGGGGPVRDQSGNIRAGRRNFTTADGMSQEQQQSGPANITAAPEPPPIANPTSKSQTDLLDKNTSMPTSNEAVNAEQQKTFGKIKSLFSAEDPDADIRKLEAMRYKEELQKQIDFKKAAQAEEKRRRQEEELKFFVAWEKETAEAVAAAEAAEEASKKKSKSQTDGKSVTGTTTETSNPKENQSAKSKKTPSPPSNNQAKEPGTKEVGVAGNSAESSTKGGKSEAQPSRIPRLRRSKHAAHSADDSKQDDEANPSRSTQITLLQLKRLGKLKGNDAKQVKDKESGGSRKKVVVILKTKSKKGQQNDNYAAKALSSTVVSVLQQVRSGAGKTQVAPPKLTQPTKPNAATSPVKLPALPNTLPNTSSISRGKLVEMAVESNRRIQNGHIQQQPSETLDEDDARTSPAFKQDRKHTSSDPTVSDSLPRKTVRKGSLREITRPETARNRPPHPPRLEPVANRGLSDTEKRKGIRHDKDSAKVEAPIVSSKPPDRAARLSKGEIFAHEHTNQKEEEEQPQQQQIRNPVPPKEDRPVDAPRRRIRKPPPKMHQEPQTQPQITSSQHPQAEGETRIRNSDSNVENETFSSDASRRQLVEQLATFRTVLLEEQRRVSEELNIFTPRHTPRPVVEVGTS
ncbi:hypothetical protein HK102_007011 [Quaeritorhiza haematococci]|nr:hypothetical protein HK102_007011 [Quaeritorhiza haematococci]